MPTFDEFYFISSTGANRIHVKTCTPDGEVRGVVQIAHGIAEHAERILYIYDGKISENERGVKDA